jgi:hypothetical protein
MVLKRSESLLSNDVLDVVLLLLQRKLLGFEKVVLRLISICNFLLSHFLAGVSVKTVHYAGSNNTHV